MSSKTKIAQLSGRQFGAFLSAEIERRNQGLGNLSFEKLGRNCGVSGKRLKQIADGKGENTSALTVRLVLYTLGFQVPSPHEDVIPTLKGKGVYQEAIHGPKVARRHLTMDELEPSREAYAGRVA